VEAAGCQCSFHALSRNVIDVRTTMAQFVESRVRRIDRNYVVPGFDEVDGERQTDVAQTDYR
jgi:hypothetical protein